MKPIEVNILGQSYVLTCPDGGQDGLLKAVSLVDSEMSAIRDAGRVKAREKIAVLAALNLAFQLVEARSNTNTSQAVVHTQDSFSQQPSGSGNFVSSMDGNSLNFNGVDVGGLIERIDSTLAPQQTQFF
jgi:cell division protein ZapA